MNMQEGFNYFNTLQKPANIKASASLIIHMWSKYHSDATQPLSHCMRKDTRPSPTFTIPEVMESWAGYGNETKHTTHTNAHIVKQITVEVLIERGGASWLNEWYSRWSHFLLASVWTATTLLCTARCLNALKIKFHPYLMWYVTTHTVLWVCLIQL